MIICIYSMYYGKEHKTTLSYLLHLSSCVSVGCSFMDYIEHHHKSMAVREPSRSETSPDPHDYDDVDTDDLFSDSFSEQGELKFKCCPDFFVFFSSSELSNN